MTKIKLYSTDYVLYDRVNDSYARYESNDEIIIYGDLEEAEMDCRWNDMVISCTDLPTNIKEEIINQLKKYHELQD